MSLRKPTLGSLFFGALVCTLAYLLCLDTTPTNPPHPSLVFCAEFDPPARDRPWIAPLVSYLFPNAPILAQPPLKQTHYTVLGIPASANTSAVRARCKAFGRRCHPDRSYVRGTPARHATHGRVMDACRALRSAETRCWYDARESVRGGLWGGRSSPCLEMTRALGVERRRETLQSLERRAGEPYPEETARQQQRAPEAVVSEKQCFVASKSVGAWLGRRAATVGGMLASGFWRIARVLGWHRVFAARG